MRWKHDCIGQGSIVMGITVLNVSYPNSVASQISQVFTGNGGATQVRKVFWPTCRQVYTYFDSPTHLIPDGEKCVSSAIWNPLLSKKLKYAAPKEPICSKYAQNGLHRTKPNKCYRSATCGWSTFRNVFPHSVPPWRWNNWQLLLRKMKCVSEPQWTAIICELVDHCSTIAVKNFRQWNHDDRVKAMRKQILNSSIRRKLNS